MTELYREIAGPLIRYAISFTGEIHSAEDIVSETFVRATEHCIVRNDLPARAWFYKVARNLALDWLRRKGRFDQSGVPETVDDSVESNPEAAAVLDENLKELAGNMEKLPEIYRTVLVLREFNDFSYAEIAGVCGVSLDNVKVLLFRAKRKLRDAYREENGHGV